MLTIVEFKNNREMSKLSDLSAGVVQAPEEGESMYGDNTFSPQKDYSSVQYRIPDDYLLSIRNGKE